MCTNPPCRVISPPPPPPDTSSTPSIEYLSSSEEGLAPSFLEARRSKKYMSKRTSGTFRDYLRSRSMEPIDGPIVGPIVGPIDGGPIVVAQPLMRRVSDAPAHQRKTTTAESSSSGSPRTSPRAPKTVVAGILKQPIPTVRRASSLRDATAARSARPYSAYIDGAHGLQSSGARATVISADGDAELLNAERSDGIEAVAERASTVDCVEEMDEPEDDDEEDDEVFEQHHADHIECDAAIRLRQHDDGNETALPSSGGFESTDDWYASVSDMEDSDDGPSKPYAYNAVNPVLECVNQVR